jgi:hypothetical protein
MRFVIFKLKHDLANDTELPLARAEIEALVGEPVSDVVNIADLLLQIRSLSDSIRKPFGSQRIQDVLLRMPYPGKYQAFLATDLNPDVDALKRRLTYCRDIFVVCSSTDALSLLNALGFTRRSLAPIAKKFGEELGPSIQIFSLADKETPWMIRILTDHALLECSDHAVRLAREVKDVDRIYSGALHHLASNFDRPFSPSVSVGYKWIEDFIDDRRAPNAYASHSLFGLRGRFFPRMVRVLSNTLSKGNDKVFLDPFGGVGTLGIEASLLGLRSQSFDINPFFTLVARAKEKALSLSDEEEAQLICVRDYAQAVRSGSHASGRQMLGRTTISLKCLVSTSDRTNGMMGAGVELLLSQSSEP